MPFTFLFCECEGKEHLRYEVSYLFHYHKTAQYLGKIYFTLKVKLNVFIYGKGW